MLSKYVKPGDKVELCRVNKKMIGNQVVKETVAYVSQIFDIDEDDDVKIYMPTEKGRLIVLDEGEEYDIIFYTKKHLYMCKCRIEERSKENNIYLLYLELLTPLRKEQRREYYRLDCMLEAGVRRMEKEELEVYAKESELPIGEKGLVPGTILDISGGGVKMVSEAAFEKGDNVLLDFVLEQNGKRLLYRILCLVLHTEKLENRNGQQEYRMKFLSVGKDEREQIIRFIFDTERKRRSKQG